ncbi:MAG: hypothetical protein NZ853_00305 [Leptospiraceae bacterium]|nr:hypothetical protein [Leptospiraceae bacterium]MDW7976329.1 hypothetical protein [Leptospiraceae bacterium]
MAKRIWASKFRFYLWMGALPFLFVGFLFLFFPGFTFLWLNIEQTEFLILLFRFLGVGLIYIFLSFIYIGNQPNLHRDLALYQSIFLFLISILTGWYVFTGRLSWFWILAIIYGFGYGLFLFLFASKNLLIRE